MTAVRALAAFFVFASVSTSKGRAQSSVIEGVARAESGGAPVAFALVRLVRADSGKPLANAPSQGITNASGLYRFSGLPPGRYRVELLRIGFQSVLSDVVEVAGKDTVQLPLRVTSQRVTLPPVSVVADVCVPANEFRMHPQLQTLWQQARDGASVRTEFMASFRYRVQSHEEAVTRKADGTPTGAVDQSYVSDPRTAVRNAARNRAQRIAQGYYGPRRDTLDGFYVPNELDVLHDDFLKTHCFVPAVARQIGEVGLRFRPLRVRRNFLDVGGTIWLDSATYLARRIEFEYVDGEVSRGTVRMEFGDISIVGAALRMPVGGDIDMRPSRTNPAKGSASRLTITYSDFEEVPRKQ
ncbi:MAG TPA: carboxypeptidase-like regulatory domain-containing protein [Gemmatimonadaceae bacterium]|nr:carboxypeptidase-like regulatory domain-containing protein [Gemmatimonadaceae bacterium]